MRRNQKQNRRGGAVAESALCLPLILIIISATVELSTTIYLKESLTIAAFEGARVAVTRDATNGKVRSRVAQVLKERHIDMSGYSRSQAISISPNSKTAEIMDPISVQVIAPTSGNTVSPFQFMKFITPPEMSATVVMRKEFTLEEEEDD